MPDKMFCDDRHVSVHFPDCAGHFPIDFGRVLWNAPVDLPIKILHDLRTALRPPRLRGSNAFPIFQQQRIGQRIGSDLGFVVIRSVGRLGIAIDTPPQRSDVQKLQCSLVVLLGGQVNWRRKAVVVPMIVFRRPRCENSDEHTQQGARTKSRSPSQCAFLRLPRLEKMIPPVY